MLALQAAVSLPLCTAAQGATACVAGCSSTPRPPATACQRSAWVAHSGVLSSRRGQKPSDSADTKLPAGACAITP
ncbi:hypothetical protein Y694_04744 [Methylibium sp. T29-B]|nr:hypothetical protein Y694_04744 [Methylibium sp. T29-B]